MQATRLLTLQKGRCVLPICIKVLRKWIFRENGGQGDPLFVGLVFADAQGAAMYAEISQEIIPLLEPRFQLNGIYVVCKFKVSNAKATYKPFEAELMIQLSEYTVVTEPQNPPQTFPACVYTITPFANLKPTKGSVPSFTDVIGYIFKVTALNHVTPKGQEIGKVLREVYIKDIRDTQLKITLWGDHATSFTVSNIYNDNYRGVVVGLFVGCLPRLAFGPSNDQDKTYMSSGTAFSCYLNPDIKEAQPFYTRFKDQVVHIELPPCEENDAPPQQQVTPLKHMTIAELNNIDDPFEFPEEGAKCTVAVTQIPNNNYWWYISCEPCKKKMEVEPAGGYRCPKCNGTETLPRYSFTFKAADDTGEANFFAYDEIASSIIGKECKAVLNPLKISDGLPQKIQEVISKRFIFSVTVTEDSYTRRDRRQYLVHAILDRSDRRGSALNAAAVQIHQPVRNPSSSTAPTVSSGGPGHTNQTQVLAVPPAQMTPPPPNLVLHTSEAALKETDRVPSKARRSLFAGTEAIQTTEDGQNTSEDAAAIDDDEDNQQEPPQQPKNKKQKNGSSTGKRNAAKLVA